MRPPPGVLARLLAVTLVSIVVSVAGVQAWSMYTIQQAQVTVAQQALETNLAARSDPGRGSTPTLAIPLIPVVLEH